MSGAELIAQERQRQIDVKGYTAQEDNERSDVELLDAALCYAGMAGSLIVDSDKGEEAKTGLLDGWPWSRAAWKPSSDPIRNLVKAGALIAAEIDFIQRRKDRP